MEPSGFGPRLKELRTAAGLTQQQLADGAGVSKATVADLEQGRYEPSWPMVLALAGALNVPLEDFRGEGSPRPRAGRGRPRKGPGTLPGASEVAGLEEDQLRDEDFLQSTQGGPEGEQAGAANDGADAGRDARLKGRKAPGGPRGRRKGKATGRKE